MNQDFNSPNSSNNFNNNFNSFMYQQQNNQQQQQEQQHGFSLFPFGSPLSSSSSAMNSTAPSSYFQAESGPAIAFNHGVGSSSTQNSNSEMDIQLHNMMMMMQGGGGMMPSTFLELFNFAAINPSLDNNSSNNNLMHTVVGGANTAIVDSNSDILLGKTNSETIIFSNTSPNSSDSSNNSKSNGTTVVEQSTEEFSPIACDHCRSQHRYVYSSHLFSINNSNRKCDKRKPSCYSCQQRGINCHYRESKRNLKKKPNIQPPSIVQKKRTETQYEPYSKPKTNTTTNKTSPSESTALTSSLSKPNMIDFYYDVVAGGYPLLSRQELENFAGKFDENQDLNTLVDFEMPSIYFSIKALCECQYGLHEQAEKSAEKAKKCLSRVFDNFSSFMVAGAYCKLIVYELWSGRFENCKFYLQILTFFEKKLFPQDCDIDSMTEYQQNLQGWIFYFDRIIFIDNRELKDLTVEDILKRLPAIFEFLHRKPFPAEWINILNTEITAENCFEIWSLVEMILNQSKAIERSNISASESKFYLEIIELVYQFILDGARISILSKSPQRDSVVISGMIDQSAIQITALTENPWFPVFPLELIAFLNAAAKVHLEKAKSLRHTGSLIHNNTDYLTLLRKDLRAFNVMRSKYKAASAQPSEVCLELEKFLHEIDTSFVNSAPPMLDSPHNDLHTRLEEFLDEFLLDQ